MAKIWLRQPCFAGPDSSGDAPGCAAISASSGKRSYGAFGANEHGSAAGIRADRVELKGGFLRRNDASGVSGRAEIIRGLGGRPEEWDVGLIFVQGLGGGSEGFAIVGHGGVIGLREKLGKGPRFPGVGGEGEVRTVLIRMFVVTTGNDAVERVAKGDGKDASGIGAVSDGSVGDLPGAAAIGGVEDAGDFTAGREPNVGIVFWEDG